MPTWRAAAGTSATSPARGGGAGRRSAPGYGKAGLDGRARGGRLWGQRLRGGGLDVPLELAQAEVDDCRDERHDRRGHSRADHVEEDAHQGAVLDPDGNRAEHGLDDDDDQEDDDDYAKDLPAVAADELARAAKGLDYAGPLDDDHRGDHRPDRQQDQAGNDQKEEADADTEAGEYPGADQRQDHGTGGPHEVLDGGVATAVLDVADQPHDHPLVEGAGNHAHRERERQQDEAVGKDPVDHGDDQEEAERHR